MYKSRISVVLCFIAVMMPQEVLSQKGTVKKESTLSTVNIQNKCTGTDAKLVGKINDTRKVNNITQEYILATSINISYH